MSVIRTVRSSRASLFQSLVDDVILGRHPSGRRADGAAPARPTLDHPSVCAATVYAELVHAGKPVPDQAPKEVRQVAGGSVAWTCVKLAGDLMMAKLEGRGAKAEELENELKMSTCDPGWVESVVDYVEFFGPLGKRGKIPYVTYESIDDFVLDTLPPDARVALLGDWGTGTETAVRLLEQIARKQPHVLLHLGDIYYSGTPAETSSNFLDVVNRVFDRGSDRVAVYTLTGNHDMYSGGVGYYQLLPRLNPFPPLAPGQAQPASFFSLRSTDGAWQLLCMDTGLHDHDPFTVSKDLPFLEASEAAWHLDKIERFDAAGGKTILFSHHQLFSAFEFIGEGTDKPKGEEAFNPKLLETFRGVLEERKVAAWFWGHEHNLDLYQPYPPLERGRCLGHGAIPVLPEQRPYEVPETIPTPPRLLTDPATRRPLELEVGEDGTYAHGYAILQLDPSTRTAEVAYYNDGDEETPFYRETLD